MTICTKFAGIRGCGDKFFFLTCLTSKKIWNRNRCKKVIFNLIFKQTRVKGNKDQTVRQNQEELIHSSLVNITNSPELIRSNKNKGDMICYKIPILYLIKNRPVIQNKGRAEG